MASLRAFPKKTCKVRFQGVVYWLLESTFVQGRCIAPLNHCNEHGEVITLGDAYAHLGIDEKIRRYLQVIGSAEDLELVVEKKELLN